MYSLTFQELKSQYKSLSRHHVGVPMIGHMIFLALAAMSDWICLVSCVFKTIEDVGVQNIRMEY